MTEPRDREAERAAREAKRAWDDQVRAALEADRLREKRERAEREARAYGVVPDFADLGDLPPPAIEATAAERAAMHQAAYGPPPGTPVRRKQRGPLAPALVIVMCLVAFVALQNPGRAVQLLTGGIGYNPANHVPQGTPHYAFLRVQRNGVTPVTYNHCAPIRYVVNPSGAPDGWLKFVTAAVEQVSKASGFEFEYLGPTDRRTDAGEDPSQLYAPVLIKWATPEEVPELAGKVIGLGGSVPILEGSGAWYASGGISLDRDSFADLADRHDTAEEQAVVMHEMGHVLGLAHVHDDGELMNADNVGRTTWGDGDRRGLAVLGSIPCPGS